MATRKTVTKSRATKKLTRPSAAPKRAPAKATARVAKKRSAVALKSATRTPAVAVAVPKANAKSNGAIARRDATGHLNPEYAADLRARIHQSAEDVGNQPAFLRNARSHDPLAEELGEEAVLTMTSGEDQSNRLQDMEVEEESGGPFVTTSGREEFARGTDDSNPADAFREPFPTT
jgi:hypothetical protein